ncbi:hypothetical protein [Oceanobacillus sp. FSL H7-0719]|uniref:hypothetical protein n=1 Tax=Oceanobacillus sp. FSL H7-0719 TaxID=2954507 RepID=UPI003243108C
MRYEVAIILDNKIIDIIKVDDVRQVTVSKDVYYLRDKKGQNIFTSPLDKTAYIKKVE